MLRAKELGFNLAELDDMTIGFVTDMLIEKSNDGEKYEESGREENVVEF